jgi:RNA polymerase sigma-70 factor (ECF subfamily)
MDEPQERLIAQGLRDGRPEAWRSLYDAFAERVWNTAARLLGSSHSEVADVVQEIFLAAARSARSFDQSQGALWSWLWGITRNQSALALRKRRQRDRLHAAANGALRSWFDSTGEIPSDPAELRELAELVRQTLTDLPEEYQSVLMAKYLAETPVEQIALEEHCSISAVRSRLARARAAFREAFPLSEVPHGARIREPSH